MTVAELIEKLKEFPLHWEVYCSKVLSIGEGPVTNIYQGMDSHHRKVDLLFIEAK